MNWIPTMGGDARAALSMWGSCRQFAPPSGCLGIDMQGDGKGGASRWRNVCQQPKYIWCVAMVLSVALLVSGLLVTEQMPMGSLLDRVGTSFKHPIAEVSRIPSTDECILPSNGTSSNSSEKSKPEEVPWKSCYAQVEEALPRGIIVPTTDLQLRSLVEEDEKQVQKAMTKNLLAMAVGIKQKQVVDGIVQKFPLNNFTIMLFHYDGIVDQWQDLAWSNQSIHVVALHQTKWWYSKRFMHPDIVDQYNYIFLWDEDFGVENFHAERYLEIMESEGLQISQPALDPTSVEIHHRITRRRPHLILHKTIVSSGCTKENQALPCSGYIEMMAPVFSKAAWKCTWHMIQNDLVHGWGIDFKLGYCVQGLRSEKIGVIDAEYILHKGILSLHGSKGGSHASNVSLNGTDPRQEVRDKSKKEMVTFQRRWTQAIKEDPTWVDPYKEFIASEMWFTMERVRPKRVNP